MWQGGILTQPGAAARDRHGIVAKLEKLSLCPLAAQNVEHMLCEFRKLVLPEGRPHRRQPYTEYAELWQQAQPILARRDVSKADANSPRFASFK